MWDLLSTQFGKPQGLVETGPEKEMRASEQACLLGTAHVI